MTNMSEWPVCDQNIKMANITQWPICQNDQYVNITCMQKCEICVIEQVQETNKSQGPITLNEQ